MDINLLVNVAARGWALPILSAMAAGVPGRQAALIAQTGAGRTAFRQSLDHLIELGLLERNPGYGHPLRPEFRITDKGADLARAAGRIAHLRDQSSDLLRRSWTVPVLVVTQEPRFFGEIRTRLGTVTDRALSTSLGQLQSVGWVAREIQNAGSLPRPIYAATAQGAEIGAEFASVLRSI